MTLGILIFISVSVLVDFGRIVSLESPSLPGLLTVALLHGQLVLLGVDSQTPPARSMTQGVGVVVILPILVTCNK